MNLKKAQVIAPKVEAMPTDKKESNNGLTVIKQEETKAEETQFTVIEEPKKRTLSEVMKLVLNKAVVLEKLEKLNQTEKNLDSFNLGKEGMLDNLQIVDGSGNKFNTNNSGIIEKVIFTIKNEIELKRTEAEQELILDL